MVFRCFFDIFGPFSAIFQLIYAVLTGISAMTCIFVAVISRLLAILDVQWLFGKFFCSERLAVLKKQCLVLIQYNKTITGMHYMPVKVVFRL